MEVARVILFFQMIKEIIEAVTIPVMAKCRIGHFAEAQILETLGVDMIDESEGMIFMKFANGFDDSYEIFDQKLSISGISFLSYGKQCWC